MLSWVEVDAGAILSNLKEFRRRVGPEVEIGAVVKSNAYGHGMLEVSRVVLEAGLTWLCVNNVEEALRLRQAGYAGRVLILGYVPLDALAPVVEHNLRLVVYNRETLERLDRLA